MIGVLGLPMVRAAGVALLVMSVGVVGLVLAHQRDAALIEAADTRATLERERAVRQESIAAAVAMVRAREQHLLDNLNRIQEKHDVQIAQARADADRAAAAAGRLRLAIGAASGSIRRALPGTGAASAAVGATASALADVVEQCVERYRAVAAAADAGHTAGQQCERAYGAAVTSSQVTR